MFCIVGATATGKSGLALELARHRPAIEIVTVDSMQVYRGMDIGTAKPTAAEQDEVPHHLIDIVDPHEDYGVSRFQHDAMAVIADIQQRGNTAVLVGGTGLYLRAVVDDLRIPGRFPEVREAFAGVETAALFAQLEAADPVAAGRMEATNRRRIERALEVTVGSGQPFSSFGAGLEQYPQTRWVMVAIDMPRPVIDQRIVDRYHAQLADGFLAEVEVLRAQPGGMSRTASQALGYKELLEHVDGSVGLDDALDLAIRRTRRFARRQERWFRRDPRLAWLPAAENPEATVHEMLRHYDQAASAAGEPAANGVPCD